LFVTIHSYLLDGLVYQSGVSVFSGYLKFVADVPFDA